MTIQKDLRKMVEVAALCFTLGGCFVMERRRKAFKTKTSSQPVIRCTETSNHRLIQRQNTENLLVSF